jgi:integrase/recombinase XerD
MPQLFEHFIRERKYLKNVSPRTIEWHEQSLKWLGIEQPTETDLQEFILRMREAGLKTASVNCRVRSVNAYLRWLNSPLRVSKLKEEFFLPSTYSAKQLRAIIRWKPRGFFQRRLHALMLCLFDTGIREDEAFSLRVSDCNLDDLLMTITGKGRKQRIIPFSLELRRVLVKFIIDFRLRADSFLFGTKMGRKLAARNVLRNIKSLCARLGFTAPKRSCHATRHTFATEYLRRGGSVFHLQKVLGHSTLEMTRRYANLCTADLQAVHERVSLLSAA